MSHYIICQFYDNDGKRLSVDSVSPRGCLGPNSCEPKKHNRK